MDQPIMWMMTSVAQKVAPTRWGSSLWKKVELATLTHEQAGRTPLPGPKFLFSCICNFLAINGHGCLSRPG